MTVVLGGGVELLERSLGYTRVLLARVGEDDLGRATPCAGWTLGDLLAHMEDALDAFTEAAGGRLERPSVPAAPRVDRIRVKACALLGTWARAGHDRGEVAVLDRSVRSDLLLAAAALEVTVHGWDVARSLGLDHPLPPDLAARLLPLAVLLVDETDRGVRFAAPVEPAATDPATRLLAQLGRTVGG